MLLLHFAFTIHKWTDPKTQSSHRS